MDKIALITGSTDGIGKAAALDLAKRGWRVILHGRSATRLAETLDEVASQSRSAELDTQLADFTDFAQVRALAGRVVASYPRLDALVNNAGTITVDRHETADGHETTWQVNFLAPFLLTRLLQPALLGAAPGRVVHVSSGTHVRGELDWDDLEMAKDWESLRAYAASKLANVCFSARLARDPAWRGIVSNSLHPGLIDTKLLRTGFSTAGGAPVDRGIGTIVRLLDDPLLADKNGTYWSKRSETQPNPLADDQAVQDKLWEYAERATGLA